MPPQEFQFNNINTTVRVEAAASLLLDTIADLDTLLGTDPNYMLGIWISMAKSWGTTPEEVSSVGAVGARVCEGHATGGLKAEGRKGTEKNSNGQDAPCGGEKVISMRSL